jgi:hypothetical protein
MMNREMRRKYQRQIKKYSNADVCPRCNQLTLFKTKTDGVDTGIVCEVCDSVVRAGPDITKTIPPNMVLPFKLSLLDRIIADMEKIKEEAENV